MVNDFHHANMLSGCRNISGMFQGFIGRGLFWASGDRGFGAFWNFGQKFGAEHRVPFLIWIIDGLALKNIDIAVLSPAVDNLCFDFS
jgi:hypothetical protein